jgi:transcriptional regulator GlxA family with amidase domain
MKAAFVIFDRLTALDLIGLYDPITRLHSMAFRPDFRWEFCALEKSVTDDRGLEIQATCVATSLEDFDVLLVPGGFGTECLVRDSAFLEWLRTADPVPLKASVCTGALLLGAAGWLRGRAATTHPNSYRELAAYCEEVKQERVVDAGEVITGRGVTAAIDVGLRVVQRIVGAEARQTIAHQMDYPWFTEKSTAVEGVSKD